MFRMIIISEDERVFFLETAKILKGADRRRFMALTVKRFGTGGQSLAVREFGWCHDTIAKGLRELQSGFPVVDNFSARGRKRAEEHLPNLVPDIRTLVDSQCQTDPSFQTERLYRRISAPEVRNLLIERNSYIDDQLPCVRWFTTKLNELGYLFGKVAKSKPKKKFLRRTPSSST